MVPIKDHIGKSFVGKRLHLKCDCIIGIDISGPCVGYKVNNNEIVLTIEHNDKHIPIGLNTPNLKIEIL